MQYLGQTQTMTLIQEIDWDFYIDNDPDAKRLSDG
jgi:hypothetical protein